ncbi:MAG: T9SS type A sorting domain-containing protein [Bacteroidota bacterium]|nr:T9SS type A sorting domain-containing protein [Bacteroidota bacterium]
MKRTGLTIIWLSFLSLFSLNAFGDNKLSIPMLEIGAGKEASVPVYLSNDSQIVAVQFRLMLPEGFVMSDTTRLSLSDRKVNHTVSIKRMNSREYLVVLYSITNTALQGNSGVLMRLPIQVPDTCQTGSRFLFQLSGVITSARNGSNLVTASEPGGLTIIDAPRPDFSVESVQAGSGTFTPGKTASVSWTVHNAGSLKAAAGWSENVSLVTDNGESVYLGTLYSDQLLNVDETVSRQATFNLSQTIGIEGAVRILVKLTPYVGSGELPASAVNNKAVSSGTVTIDKLLRLSLNRDALGENEKNPLLGYVYRSGSRLTEQTFAISTTNASRLKAPESVNIPAGSSGGVFYLYAIDNTYASLDTTIQVSASGNGYQTANDSIVLVDNEIPSLNLSASKTALTEGESFTLTISRQLVTNTPLNVLLSTDVSGRMSFTSECVIPANEKSVTITVSTTDDAVPSLAVQPVFTATAASYSKGVCSVELADNDIPTIEMSLTPASVSESAGYQAVVGVVKRQGATTNAITIKLSDNAGGTLFYLSNTITLEKGVAEKKFTVGIVDNDVVEGSRTYSVLAAVYLSSCGCTASAANGGTVQTNLTVLDDDGPSLKLSTSQTMLPEGKTNAAYLTLSRNTTSSDALAVTLSSDHVKDLSFQTNVVIPVGSTSVQIPVSVLKNDSTEGDRTVTFSATASGYSKGTCWAMISDQTLSDARIAITSLSSTVALAKASVDVKVKVMNEGVVKLPSYQDIEIYYGSDSLNLSSSSGKLLTTFYTSKDVLPGSSETFTTMVAMPDLTGVYYLFAIVNADQGTRELSYLNNTSKPFAVQLQAPYTATVIPDRSIYKPGEAISLTGQLTARNNSSIAGVAVEIYLMNNSERSTIKATTDANGAFQTTYTPYTGQIGHFEIGACYPGEGLQTAQAVFDIYGLRRTTFTNLFWDVLVNEENTGEIELINPGNLALTNLKTTVSSDTANYSLTFDPISYMAGGSMRMLRYHLKAKKTSTGNDWEKITFQLCSDEGATLDIPAYFYGRTAQANLTTSVSSIQTTMCKGKVRNYSFTVTNKGKGASGAISVLLPGLSWLSLVTPVSMPSLANGESSTITLQLAPGEDLPANVPITGTIGINCENGNGIPLSFRIETVSEQTGSLAVDVCDEYTYYTAEAPHLVGASVVLKHPYTQEIVAQGVTDEKGVFRADSLMEGYYTLVVTASQHDTYTNNILIDPGKVNTTLVNLSFQAITYSWNVVETEVKDEYTIVSTVKFETNVPTPVVVTEAPDKIDGASILPGQFIIYNVTVTNKGLITAKDVNITIPVATGSLVFEALAETHFDLKPQSSVVIPVKVTNTSTTAAGSSMALRSASAINDISCNVQTITIYYWDCGLDRKWHEYSKSMNVFVCASSGSSGYSPGGGGGWYGPGGGGTSSYTPNYQVDPPAVSDYSCEPCQNRFMYKMTLCLLKRVPIISQVIEVIEVVQEVQVLLSDGTIKIERIIERIPKIGEKIVGYYNVYKDCIEPLFEKCVPGDFVAGKRMKAPNSLASDSSNTLPSYIVHYKSVLRRVSDMMDASEAQRLEVFGDSAWISLSWNELNDFWDKLIALEGKVDTTSGIYAYKPQIITDKQFFTFLDRWNNTKLKLASENSIDQAYLRACYDTIQAVINFAKGLGYNSVMEMFNEETALYEEEASKASSSVCSSITLKFSQTMTMTRQAFRGTLTIFNGNKTDAMQQVKLNLVITDANGNQVGSHEFQVNTESLDKLTAIDGTGKLAAQETGTATILFIPTKYAAPLVPQEYSFGGTLSYLDPFSGTTVRRELYPVTLTVKPSPDLYLTYFMQRDVLGDDPLTLNVVENMEPAEFSVLINNKGAGDATKVKIAASQPQIVDNEKGLLIDFKLTASSLNGAPGSFGVTDVDFGTIPAGICSFGQWWFTSTLLGHFVEYNIEATHVTSYDNPDLSLIGGVSIHELIRSIKTSNAFTALTGFLANDLVDSKDMPDMLYLSDGSTQTVNLIKSDPVFTQKSSTVYEMTVTPDTLGWNYGVFEDPVLGKQTLLSVTRKSTGESLSLRNVWQTDRTLRDGHDPLYEYRLHLADHINTTSETYVLTFEPVRENQLTVVRLGNVPEKVSSIPVQQVTVQFNRPIIDSTFTCKDLTLNCQGEPVDLDSVTIAPVDSVTYAINLSSVNKQNGYYVLTVQTRSIKDREGVEGKYGKMAAWNQYLGNGVRLNLKAMPEGSGVLTPDSGLYTYGTTVRFMAKPQAGYRFKNWTIDGATLGSDSVLTYTATENKTLQANFELQYRDLTITYNTVQGSVTGGTAGFYPYGTTLTLEANPALNYVFAGWKVNGTLATNENQLVINMTESKHVEALFVFSLFTVDHSFGQGWNWLSSNFSDASLADPKGFLSPVLDRTVKLLGFDNELVTDPVYGLVGGLNSLSPSESYKLDVNLACRLSLKGTPYKLSDVSINVQKGWNWIGYLPSIAEAPAIAFGKASPRINEAVKNQTDFSVYDGSAWVGTLEQMKPGEGYLFYADSARSFQYEGTDYEPGLAARALRAAVVLDDGWLYNTRKYPDNMNMIVSLQLNGLPVNPDEYTLAAFAGDECRGIGKIVGSLYFMTVYGQQANEAIDFKVLDKATGKTMLVNETALFGNKLVGTLNTPVRMMIGADITDLAKVASNILIYPNPVRDKLYLSSSQPAVDGIRIYQSDGRLVTAYTNGNAYREGIDVSTLPTGLYIITLSTSNGVYYQRFIKLGGQ